MTGSDPALTDYDRVRYRSIAYPRTHPAHLAALATVVGGDPAPVEQARILEVGCGGGGNLLPIAASLPGAWCVGVDPAATEIAAARHATAALGLERVDWRPAGIEEPLPEGLFDYVIAHGVLSWIPPEAQDALWAVLAERTAPGAVVYLSFNTWPGWSTRGMVRDLMRFRTRGIAEPGARVRAAREVLAALAAETPATTLWGAILAAEKRVVDAVDDWYLFHDHLSDHNTPYWFEEVAARAAAAGLSYAGDAEPARSPCPSRALAAFADSSVALAQGGDFARMTMFREAVFVRGPARPGEPDPARVSGLSFWARARVESSAPLRIVTGGSTVTLTDPTAEVAYRALLAALPAAVPFGTLASVVPGDADHLAAVLLQLWLGSEAVGARRGGPSPVRAVTARPEVWSHARWQCARGEAPVNLRLDAAPIGPLAARLAPWLDGTRDRGELVAALGQPPPDDELRTALLQLAAAGLLVGRSP